jgi:oxalate decarboxylase/phosphoglucose isomerase-like protein (cupin superfamily)
MDNQFNFKQSDPRAYGMGVLFRASKEKFPVLQGLAIQGLKMKTEAIREPHVHPNAHQLDYCVAGEAIVGIVEPGGKMKELHLKPGDISFVPQGYLHWIKNIAKSELEFLVVLSHEEPETLELSEMLTGVPSKDIQHMYGVKEEEIRKIRIPGVIY